MAFDDFKHKVAFHSICDNIEKKKNLSENSNIYLQWAKEYFTDVTKTLDSMISSKEAYYFTPHVKELIGCLGENRKYFSKEDVVEVKNKVKSLSDKLDQMKEHPLEFYNTQDSKEVFDFLKKFVIYFDEDDEGIRVLSSNNIF